MTDTRSALFSLTYSRIMFALEPAVRATSGSSWLSEPSIHCQPPSTLGSSFKGNGQTAPASALTRNCQSRQNRIPPEIPRSRQVTIIHTQGDAAVLAAVGFALRVGAVNNGRTDI